MQLLESLATNEDPLNVIDDNSPEAGLLADISSWPTPSTHSLPDSSTDFLPVPPMQPITIPILDGILSCPSPLSHPLPNPSLPDPSFPAPPPPPSLAGPLRRRRKKISSAADNVVLAYPRALELQRRGETSADAIKGTGLPKSTFYKWKPVAELLLVDPAKFDLLDDRLLKPGELLASCKAALNEDRLRTKIEDLRRSGELFM